MAKRLHITPEMIQQYKTLVQQNDALRVSQLGALFRAEYPEILGHIGTPLNVHKALQREAEAQGIEFPRRPPGKIPKPKLRWAGSCPELRFAHRDRIIVVSDLHSSAHDVLYVERARDVIERLGIKTIVYCGDQLDNAYLGHGGIRSIHSAPFEENIDHFVGIANTFEAAGAEEAFAIQGNHDDKPLRTTDGETTYSAWWDAHIAPGLDTPEMYSVTHRYYCVMEPEINESWPWTSGHRAFPWTFMHAKEYSIIAGRNPKMHGDVRLSNIINGHEHHLLTTKHPNGITWLGAAGTGQHRDSAAYKDNRPTKHPAWQQGFITIIDNYPETWHIHEMDQRTFDRRTR